MTQILIVDDSPDIQFVLGAMLEDEGYAVLLARDGQTACRLAKIHRPVVVLMDLQLPKLDGVEATRRLKQDPATAHIPVIAISAQPERLAKVEALADDTLAKPFEMEDLLKRVQRYALTVPQSTAPATGAATTSA